jgi:LasA protease
LALATEAYDSKLCRFSKKAPSGAFFVADIMATTTALPNGSSKYDARTNLRTISDNRTADYSGIASGTMHRYAHRTRKYIWSRSMLSKLAISIFPLCLLSLSAMAATSAPTALELLASSAFTEIQEKTRLVPHDLVVEVLKQNEAGTHVMGAVTEVLPSDVHGAPTMRLFFAHQNQGAWNIGMEGSEAFDTELESMPLDVVSQDERSTLTLLGLRQEALTAPRFLNLGLPWREGNYWTMTAGPHGYSGWSLPYSSIDFSSDSDGDNVRTAAWGLVYTTCVKDGSALVTIVHENGYRTSYYHMEKLEPFPDGRLLASGIRLGSIGNGLPCGGSSTGAHVHFTVLNNRNEYISVNNAVLGGWTFHSGLFPYTGSASRGQQTVSPRGLLFNFGAGDRGI